jgi:hypothetical protein
MTIIQLQQLLGHLYRDTYKGNTAIQLCILELGYTIQRLLENELITPYDDYEEKKQIIFEEYRGVTYGDD